MPHSSRLLMWTPDPSNEAAAGFGIAGALFVVGPWYSAIGVVIAVVGLYAWAAEPVSKDDHH